MNLDKNVNYSDNVKTTTLPNNNRARARTVYTVKSNFFKRGKGASRINALWLSFFLDIFCLCLPVERQALAAAQADDFGGALDQSFSAGYSQRSFAEGFHVGMYEDSTEQAPEIESWDTWQFYKGFNFSTVYDSNIFSARNNQKDDVIFSYVPTIGLGKKGRNDFIDIFYDLSYIEYIENSKLNRFNHSITTRLGYKLPKLSFHVSNNFKPDTAYAVGERTELKLPETSHVITYSDDLRAKISYELSPKTNVYYKHQYTLYYFPTASNSASVNSFSTQKNVFAPGISYEINPKLRTHGEYSFEIVDFFEGGAFDSESHVLMAGVVAVIAPTVTMNLDGGYRWRHYSSAPITDGEGFEFKAALSKMLSKRVSASLWLTRNIQEDFNLLPQSPTEIVDYYGSNFTWDIYQRVQIKGGVSAGFTTREESISRADVENSKLIFNRNLEDEFYQGDISLTWNPRPFLSILVGYAYFNKNSTFKDFEYDDHKGVLSVKLKF